jgi:hypothetical protein
MTLIIYFFKEQRRSFGRPIQNAILIFSAFAAVLSLTFLIHNFSLSIKTRSSLLTGLGNPMPPEIVTKPIAKVIMNGLTLIQAIILCLLLYVSYHLPKITAKKKRNFSNSLNKSFL